MSDFFDTIALYLTLGLCFAIFLSVTSMEVECRRPAPVEKTVTPYVEKTT